VIVLPPICGWAPIATPGIADKWRDRRGHVLGQLTLKTLGLPLTPNPQLVHTWVNRNIAYVPDRNGDDWQTAQNTLTKRTGDCEDYAILKHRLLRAQGMPDDDLSLLLAYDAVAHLDHALLLGAWDGKWHALDHRTDSIIPLERLTDYRPVIAYQNARTFTFPTRVK
jgi:predicted transglutaminase-like cysteine proteinase